MKNIKILMLVLLLGSFAIINLEASTSTIENAEKVVNKKHDLKFNPKVKTNGKMVVSMEIEIEMEAMGQKMITDQDIEMATFMKVVSNKNEEIKTSVKYDYFAMVMDIPMMGEMKYDTRDEVHEGMFGESMDSVFSELLKGEMFLYQDHTGKTIRMEGMESLEGVQQGQGGTNMNSLMGMSQFPSKPVAIGDTWTKKIGDKTMPMAFDATYTLKRVDGGKVYIDFVSEVTLNEKYDGEQTMKTVKGKQTGTLIYEEGTMWMIEGMIKQNFEMSVDQMGMEFPMVLESDIIMSME